MLLKILLAFVLLYSWPSAAECRCASTKIELELEDDLGWITVDRYPEVIEVGFKFRTDWPRSGQIEPIAVVRDCKVEMLPTPLFKPHIASRLVELATPVWEQECQRI